MYVVSSLDRYPVDILTVILHFELSIFLVCNIFRTAFTNKRYILYVIATKISEESIVNPQL